MSALRFSRSGVLDYSRLSSRGRIFDPQSKFILLCNKLFFISCIVAVSLDPLFFYLPVINKSRNCLGIDRKLAITIMTLRTVIDAFYLVRMALQFRTAYIAPSSPVFGRGELVVDDQAQIAKRYLMRYFIVDFLAVFPLLQITVLSLLQSSKSFEVLTAKHFLFFAVLLQYVPRILRIISIASEKKRAEGVTVKTAWAGAAYYLLLYMLASHIIGALWYLLALERTGKCWQDACKGVNGVCNKMFLYCGNQNMRGYGSWASIRDNVLQGHCSGGDNSPFDFGIYKKSLSSNTSSSSMKFVSKLLYCLWWGLQNLSTLGQGLETSTYPGEITFCLVLAVLGLILFALLIGNMQTYLQSHSDTIRLEEELRVKQRDSEQWMNRRKLPLELRERVRRYEQYKWKKTRGVDEETIVQSLPKDLRMDILRHLCLDVVKLVPFFGWLDARSLDTICERLKPCLFTETSYLAREGDSVDRMFFITRGRLECVWTGGLFNRIWLEEGDFCGEELLTWALDPKSSGSDLPLSAKNVRALTEVEAFSLTPEEVNFIASRLRRLDSRQLQHVFRYYSPQWKTWAAFFIQAAWRRYSMKKNMKIYRDGNAAGSSCSSSSSNHVFHRVHWNKTLQKPLGHEPI